jgi:hypothetical protein
MLFLQRYVARFNSPEPPEIVNNAFRPFVPKASGAA